MRRQDEPYDPPDDEDEDLFRLDEDDDLLAQPSRSRRSSGGGGLSLGRLIGGILQVILIAVLALVLFAAIGFGVAFGGQKLGLLPTRQAQSETVQPVAAVPTQVPPTQASSAPTQAELAQVATQPPAASSTTAASDTGGCPAAAPWWNSPQVQQTYQYFLAKAINEARSSNNLSALLDSMNIKSSFVANFHMKEYPDDACLAPVRNALGNSFSEIANAVQALQSGDEAGVTQHQDNATKLFAQVTVELWTLNVNVDADAPPSVGVARGSGAACGAPDWYTATKAQLDAFFKAADQMTVQLQPNEARTQLNDMQAAQNAITSAAAPDCVAKPKAVLLDALNSDVSYLKAFQRGNADSTQRSDFEQKYRLFNAWMAWLGVL